MDAFTAVALSMHRDGIDPAEIADALGLALADVTEIVAADQPETEVSPLTAPQEAGVPDAAELLAWAAHHRDSTVREYGVRVGELLATLAEQHGRDRVELADVLGEIDDLEQMLGTLRRRAVLLQGLPDTAPLLSVVADQSAAAQAPARDADEPVDAPAVRAWARANGVECGDNGRLPKSVIAAWREATNAAAAA